MKVKRVLAIMLLVSIMIIGLPAISMAQSSDGFDINQQENGIMPRLTYIVDAESKLSINGTTATVDCWVNGHYDTATKAKVIAELQVKNGNNWIPTAIWTDTQNGYEAYVYEEKSVTTGNTYRVKATVTVWEGSQSEELILFTNERTA